MKNEEESLLRQEDIGAILVRYSFESDRVYAVGRADLAKSGGKWCKPWGSFTLSTWATIEGF